MVDLTALLTDLATESEQLDALVAPLPPQEWQRPTPAAGWTIAHQIAHLAWTDHVARLAATDTDAFYASVTAAPDPGRLVDDGAVAFLAPPAVLLTRWREGRSALATALAASPAGEKLPWYGTRMSPASMATARIMETWAHGEDVAEALGVTRATTDRLRHIAYLGFRTVGHSFAAHGRAVPTVPVRVELTAPGGENWTFGPADATDRVTGPALDFCLLVTRRRHRADTALVATGPVADGWLDVAQAFAGPPGTGRAPRTTASGAQP
ncbi:MULTISPECIES: TIGR03084 family metal-binding protein [unclassified Micromonospora]|uniref:TIGR03084 family metal-binding protein n=1 Tax=unclassified Micromonospora TaxID=2617518 RepID=UPI0022B6D2FB|nr:MULTISPECIES: TIGR03084 family metal-binding protein [unclassified Micromonospora]MCZ7419479.1 TIGR03084 family metal-binding protein [Verrucosispora sp. WMMA2121]WBB93112.1 TIGR03084 family metal-binding protein [Verrucosispora sp. WMMC514]